MRELEEVAESFRHTLQSMMHSRVAYPGSRTERTDTVTPLSRSNLAARLGSVNSDEFGRSDEDGLSDCPTRVPTLPPYADPHPESPALREGSAGVAAEICGGGLPGMRAALPGWPICAYTSLREIEVAIVSDRVIARVHQEFMGIPGPTDVITFEHGEIVMSADTASTQAARFRHAVDVEIGALSRAWFAPPEWLRGFRTLGRNSDAKERKNRIMKACLKRISAP